MVTTGTLTRALPVPAGETWRTTIRGLPVHRNSFITELPVSAATVAALAACGRARWQIENESFNVLKTKGNNLEHNFGHGRRHLAAVLATLNLLAFARHTVCELADTLWRGALKAAGARKRFFEPLRAVTVYLVFPTWKILLTTLATGRPPPPAA